MESHEILGHLEVIFGVLGLIYGRVLNNPPSQIGLRKIIKKGFRAYSWGSRNKPQNYKEHLHIIWVINW